MDVPPPITVQSDLSALRGELEHERFRHVAGIERTPSLEDIFARRNASAHRRTVDSLRSGGQPELANAVAEARAERAAAGLEEAWRAAEASSQPDPGWLRQKA